MWTFTTVKVSWLCLLSSWCPFPHNLNFSDLSCRDAGEVTPNTKTIFFHKLLFITALTDISREKMLTSPIKSLGSFSLFNGDIFLSVIWIVIFTASSNSSSLNLKCVQGYHLKRAGQASDSVSSDGSCFVCWCPAVWGACSGLETEFSVG